MTKRPIHLIPRPCNTDHVWLASSSTLEHVMDQLELLLRLESSTTYQRQDYLRSYHYYRSNAINEKTRHCMVELLYEIGDYCQFKRETVAYAIYNLMDRYLSCNVILETVADFQLVASTALYIAVKVLEPVSMDVQSLADLGQFSAADILQMERNMLMTLQWRIAHGPTPMAFLQLFLAVLQMDGRVVAQQQVFDVILEHAQYQVELALLDYKLLAKTVPSEIALAAVWNALECNMDYSDTVQQWQHQLIQYLAKTSTISTGQCLQQRLDKLPRIQLQLCKLQYTAEECRRVELLYQQQQQEEEEQEQQQQAAVAGWDYYHHHQRGEVVDEEAGLQEQQHPEQRNPYDHYYYDCDYNKDHNNNDGRVVIVDETEVEEEDELLQEESSPVSVMNNPLFLTTTSKAATSTPPCSSKSSNSLTIRQGDDEDDEEEEEESCSSYYYGLSFLRRLFFV